MTNDKVFAMSIGKVYPLLVAKAVKKGRSADEVDAVASWLTGYSGEEIHKLVEEGISYREFFENAPEINPDAIWIRGSICGVKIEQIEDPLMKQIRYLDKLVDELAKGKTLEKILNRKKV